MARKRKVPDAADLEWGSNRLWNWLVENAGADVKKSAVKEEKGKVQIPDTLQARLGEASRIAGEVANGSSPALKRIRAAARAFMNLGFSVAQREAANQPVIPTENGKKLSYLGVRARAMDKATEAAQALTHLRKLTRYFAKWASDDYKRKFPAGEPNWVVHSPLGVAAALAALYDLFGEAIRWIDICRIVFEEMGDYRHVWGTDLDPRMLRTLDNTALDLYDGGFTVAEIVDLLDEWLHDPAELVERWQKRIERARRSTSAHGAPLSRDMSGGRASPSSRAASTAAPRSATSPRRRSRRARR